MLKFSKAAQLGHTAALGTTKENRRALLKRLNTAWGMLVRARDKRCVWCGSVKKLNAHHIVARGIGNNSAHVALNNGMTLCFQCHIHRLKQDPDGYIVMRDAWLKKRGLSYEDMLLKYRKGFGVRYENSELEVVVCEMEKAAGLRHKQSKSSEEDR